MPTSVVILICALFVGEVVAIVAVAATILFGH
jgi:hypothetical protein